MSEIHLEPCPFCGAKINAFICNKKDCPEFWANGLWFLEDNHQDYCFLKYNELFGSAHFGKAVDGKPTETLLEYADKWNRRAK